VLRTLAELLAIPELQLVIVATPNTSHFSIAKECLEHDRHVVIDKPFTTTSGEARELMRLASDRGKLLSVYQNRRWDGDFQTVQKIIADGVLGRIVSYESHFDRYRPEFKENAWRERNEPGSGILFDLGPHLLDQAMQLFGVPEAIDADVRSEREGGQVDDAFDVTLFYGGMRALLRASVLAAAPGPRFSIRGTLGSYTKYGLDPQEDELKKGLKPGGDAWGLESEALWGTLHVERDGSIIEKKVPTLAGDYRKYYENVRNAVEGRAPIGVTPEQALNVMIALELAMKSSTEGRRISWSAAE